MCFLAMEAPAQTQNTLPSSGFPALSSSHAVHEARASASSRSSNWAINGWLAALRVHMTWWVQRPSSATPLVEARAYWPRRSAGDFAQEKIAGGADGLGVLGARVEGD